MNESLLIELLEAAPNVILRGHFVLASGRHADTYVEKYNIFADTELTGRLCQVMADQFRDEVIDVVIGPKTGGIIVAHVVAAHLRRQTRREVKAIFSEQVEGVTEILHGYARFLGSGVNVLVVEDVLTSGDSVREVVEAVRQRGSNVIGLAAMWNRGGVTEAMVGDVPRLFSAVNKRYPTWSEDELPNELRRIPVSKNAGHG